MSILSGILQVFSKELREMMRDRRVLQASFVMPIFVIAIFVFILGIVQKAVTEKPQVRIAYVNNSPNQTLLNGIDTDIIQQVESFEKGAELVRKSEVQLVIESPITLDFTGRAQIIRIGYLDSSALSSIALASIRNNIAELNLAQVKTVLEANNLDPNATERIKVDAQNLGKEEGIAGSPIVSLLPYLIVLWAFYGGMSIVADLVAGEKERGTMETLLISPIRRASVAVGKGLALMVVCFVGSLTTLAGVFLAGTIRSPLTASVFPSGLSIGLGEIALAVITLITLVAFFASIMLCLSAYARNIREAQTYLGLLSFIIIMPAIFSQIISFTGLENAAWVSWTPVLNTAMVIRNVILGNANFEQMGPTWLVNLVLAAIFMRLSIQLFRREEIVLRV
jgi:sodium transport system permease protein